MREILFRGICTETGDWETGFYVRLNGKEHRIYNGYAETDCGDYYPDFEQVAPETLGMFTGLTDKNGTKIYEGDIAAYCWYKDEIMSFRIDYVSGEFLAVPVKKREDVWAIRISGQGENLEVIGNIHDNPELLEVNNG